MAEQEIDERAIRLWFMKTDLMQAGDTLNVCIGIIETRRQAQPTRKPRSDAGTKRKPEQPSLLEKA